MGAADDGNHRLFQAGKVEGPAKQGQRVGRKGGKIEQRGIEVLLTGLLLFGAPVVVDGKKNGAVLPTGAAQVNGRLAAVTADLEAGPQARGLQGQVVEPLPFLRVQETLDGVDEFWVYWVG